jgi:hypothetical protein
MLHVKHNQAYDSSGQVVQYGVPQALRASSPKDDFGGAAQDLSDLQCFGHLSATVM